MCNCSWKMASRRKVKKREGDREEEREKKRGDGEVVESEKKRGAGNNTP